MGTNFFAIIHCLMGHIEGHIIIVAANGTSVQLFMLDITLLRGHRHILHVDNILILVDPNS